MKLRFLLASCAACVMFATAANAQVHVNGYTRSNGTYVQPHMRSAPDSTTSNNYSHIGNTNPYTGEAGTHTDNNNSTYGGSAPSFPGYQQPAKTNSLYGSDNE